MCIHNNKSGADARTLARFKEPSWNNPVVRIVTPDGRDLVARNGDRWTVGAVAEQMVGALDSAQKPIPRYLALLADEQRARRVGLERAVFGMG